MSYQQKYPYSDCEIDENDNQFELSNKYEYYKILQGLNITYRQVNCLELCLQIKVSEICKCYDSEYDYLKKDSGSCFHDTGEKFDCIFRMFKEFGKLHRQDCLSKCPLECNSTSYNLRSSLSLFPTMTYAKTLLKNNHLAKKFDFNQSNIDINKLRERILSVNIFFDQLQEIRSSESVGKTSGNVFSEIGGSLGLFLGLSILGIIEIIEIIGYALYSCIRSMIKKE